VLGALSAAALAGLASIPHCAGMCGPLAAFACRSGGVPRYQLGRLVGYSAAGALAGGLGATAASMLAAPIAQALLSWTLAAGLAWAAYRLWRSAPSKQPQLVQLQTKKRRVEPAFVGFATTFLPCGALAAALLIAAGSGSIVGGALSMLAFAGTSMFGLLGASLLAAKLRTLGLGPRRMLAVALALGAIVLVLRPIDALRGEPAQCHTVASHP